MSFKGWYNKKDVIRDLAKISGIRDVDENFVVVGGQPPPQLRIGDDDESQMLRLYGGTEISQLDSDICQPDLAGITHMLRMVDNYNEALPKTDVVEPIKEININKNEVKHDTILTISKLNPQVEEFIPLTKPFEEQYPKRDTNDAHNKETNKYSDNKTILFNIGDRSDESNKAENFTSSCISNTSNFRINVSELKQEEIIKMRKQLKHKIIDSSKTNCVKVKRERNIAIATLLKLHSQSPNPSAEREKPLKLITPNYFETKLPDNVIDVIAKEEIISKPLIHKNSKHNNNTEECPNVPNQVLLNQFVKREEKKTFVTDEDVIASVDKVYNWLKNVESDGNIVNETNANNKEAIETSVVVSEDIVNKTNNKTSKPFTAFLGPVMFRRKGGNSNSPSLSASDNTATISQGPMTKTFVPSEYANELTKSYTERAKARKAVAQDIWMKLETELKAKDELIKAKKEKEIIGL